MKEEVRRRIINDLVVTPFVLGPAMLGLTAFFLGWAVGSFATVGFGLAGVLGGIGVLATKFLWNIDEITKGAYEKVIAEKENDKAKRLDLLEQKLCKDRDPIPETCLRQLRLMRQDILAEAKNNPLGSQVLENFERMFDICVTKLEETDALWQKAKMLAGVSKKNVVQRRAVLVAEIESITNKIAESVKTFQKSVSTNSLDKELEDRASELTQILEVARRTGERMNNLESEKKSYDPKEFE